MEEREKAGKSFLLISNYKFVDVVRNKTKLQNNTLKINKNLDENNNT